ncbi:MAG: NERD domain-containing protein [Actinomycetota bacterium]|nr:NERD domain-containing protein [Actinomycetota bacterium]
MFSYPRQQQYSRLARASVAGAFGVAAILLALVAGANGAVPIPAVLVLVALGLGLRCRHWARLAGRSSIGAQSEDQVQRGLSPLEAEGWRLFHSLPWQGRGDIDSVAIAPTGFAFAIETKTRTYTPEHLARVRDVAACLNLRRRRWCRKGALPVLCVVRDRGLERVEAGVLVVSIDRLSAALRTAARTRKRPAFLSPTDRPRATR